jgi:hypothetical protein
MWVRKDRHLQRSESTRLESLGNRNHALGIDFSAFEAFHLGQWPVGDAKEAPKGNNMTVRVGHILRHEDETGVSGTGVVAEWIEYSDGEVAVHWLSHTPSTNLYRNIKQVEAIHGHGGRTEMVTIWEEPKPVLDEDPETAEPQTENLGSPEKTPEIPEEKSPPKRRANSKGGKKTSSKKKED